MKNRRPARNSGGKRGGIESPAPTSENSDDQFLLM
jgi:hypothetical protein